jgi:RNA-directed DNA polymerase
MDAVHQVWNTLNKPRCSQWILKADISNCFDNVIHEPLLHRIPVFRAIIRRWLKIGVIERGQYQYTEKGIIQGGIISPLLLNITLDGMERLFGIETKTGKYLSPSKRRGLNKGISLIRYADDFIITAPSKTIISTYVLPKLKIFLQKRGLTLNQTKTQIVHRTKGFNFLGFTLRYYKSDNQKFLLCYPKKGKIFRYLNQIKTILIKNRQNSLENLIKELTPAIRGWTNYYRYSSAKGAFIGVNQYVLKMIRRWIRQNYITESRNWYIGRNFTQSQSENNKWLILCDFSISYPFQNNRTQRYVKVRGYASPFDFSVGVLWFFSRAYYVGETIHIGNTLLEITTT